MRAQWKRWEVWKRWLFVPSMKQWATNTLLHWSKRFWIYRWWLSSWKKEVGNLISKNILLGVKMSCWIRKILYSLGWWYQHSSLQLSCCMISPPNSYNICYIIKFPSKRSLIQEPSTQVTNWHSRQFLCSYIISWCDAILGKSTHIPMTSHGVSVISHP